jgi:hypothetical protein
MTVELREQGGCRLSRCRRRVEVVAEFRDDMSHASTWVGHVSVEPRDDVDVEVVNGLSGCCAGVESDVVPMRREFSVESSLDIIDEFEHREAKGR